MICKVDQEELDITTKWMIQVEKVDNGYILTKPYPEGEGYFKAVFQESDEIDTCLIECNVLQELLWNIADEFRPYSKHNTYNVVINVRETKEE